MVERQVSTGIFQNANGSGKVHQPPMQRQKSISEHDFKLQPGSFKPRRLSCFSQTIDDPFRPNAFLNEPSPLSAEKNKFTSPFSRRNETENY